ncbi:MAG: carboxypeptidase regulatory-like domain-containing protein, partial [Verrucomicrobiota bacterium]
FRKRLRRLAVTDEPMIAEVKRVVREISPSRPYRINLTEAVHVPAVHGLFRPEILLPPSSIETLDEEALRLILWHEIAHLRRGDLWVNWLLFYLQAIHWFNPAMWWAFRKIRIAAESAADAWVLRQSRCEAKPVDYGEALLGFLERENSATARHFLPGLVRVVERPQDLKARIKAIARFSRKRSRWATAATCALLLGLSAVGLTQAPEEKKSEEATQANLEIRATVRDENGDPVQDATVTLVAYTPFSKRTLEAVSDRDGEAIFDPAELDELPGRMNGEFYAKKETVGLSARGYTFSWDEGKRKSVAVELVLSEGLPLRLRVVDLEGFPVEGLEVFASRFSEKDRESGFLSANPSKLESNPWSATTNSNGEATLRRIPRNAKVYVDHRDNRYGQVEGAHHTQFRFDPEAEEENRIELEPASTISGRVVLPGDLPVAGAEVRALEHYGYVRGGSHGNAVTSANGTFTLPRMLASVYSIKVTLPDDLAKDWVVPILRSVEVEIGEDILLDDLVGESGGLIEGRVTLPDSGDGVPYAQVGITVPEKVSPLYQWWGKADESGRYRIRLESGLKKLYLGGLPPEGYRRPAQENRTILVLEGQTQEADFSFENASEFSGRVVDEEGNPVEGAIVQSWPQSFPVVRASTDEEGNFAFTPFDTTNELSVIAHKGNSFSGEAAITPESFIDLVLLKNGFASVSGKVIDEDGKPVRGAMVRWFGQRLSESFDVETGPDGTFSIDRLVPSESFGVSAEKTGHGKVSLYAATSRGKNTSLPNLILPKAESMVSGQVT